MNTAPAPARFIPAMAILLLAILLFDAMAICVRLLLPSYTALELSVYRNVLGVLPSVALLLWTRDLPFTRAAWKIKRWKLALMRGVIVALAQVMFYSSLGFLELATVSALSQINGVFVVLVSVIVLHETVGPWRWGAVLLGLAGALLIMRPGSDAFSPASLLPIGAALCYAVSMVTVRLFDSSISNSLLYLYSSAATAVAALVMAAFTGGFSPIQSGADLGVILLMSLFGGTAVLLLMVSYRMAPPSALAPFGYFGILTAFLFGWLIFDELPVGTLFPGVILIVVAGLVIVWREGRTARSKVPPSVRPIPSAAPRVDQ